MTLRPGHRVRARCAACSSTLNRSRYHRLPRWTALTAPPRAQRLRVAGEMPVVSTASRNGRIRPPLPQYMRVLRFKPVWLFAGETQRIVETLGMPGPASVSTDEGTVSLAVVEKLAASRPLRLLAFDVSRAGVSVILEPMGAEVWRQRDWRLAQAGSDVVAQVREMLNSRCRGFFFLGEREWQLLAAVLTLGLQQAMVGLQIYGLATDAILLAAVIAGAIVVVWAIAGLFVPDRRHVAVWRISRQEFRQRLWHAGAYLSGVAGMVIDSTVAAQIAGLAAGIAIATGRGPAVGRDRRVGMQAAADQSSASVRNGRCDTSRVGAAGGPSLAGRERRSTMGRRPALRPIAQIVYE